MSKKASKVVGLLLAILMVIVATTGWWLFHSGLFNRTSMTIDKVAARRTLGTSIDGILIDELEVPLGATFDESEYLPDIAREAFDKINKIRVDNGVAPLKWDDNLIPATNVRAKEVTQKWSHTRPNGYEYWTADSKRIYGENLAKGYSNAESVVNAWMASQTHKDNILYTEFKTCAIAVYRNADGNLYWANEFGLS